MIAILKHKYMVMLTISAITLQSCFVAKDYKQPELIETQNLFRTDELPTDSVSMADVSWKTLFTDAYLNQYIDEGLQNNMDIRIAIQQILSAEAYLKQGKAGYFPTLNGNANVNRSYISGNGQQESSNHAYTEYIQSLFHNADEDFKWSNHFLVSVLPLLQILL